MAKKRKHLGEILYKAGVVEKQPLINAIKTSKSSKRRLGEVLLELGLVDQKTLTKAIAKQFGLKYVDLDKAEIPGNPTEYIPEDLIKKHSVLPLGMTNGKLKVIISDPMDLETMDALRFRLNKDIDYYLSEPSKITASIEEAFEREDKQASDRLKHSIDATATELSELGHSLDMDAIQDEEGAAGEEGPIVRLINLIVDNAYYMRASDIHVEPMHDRVRIRYRIDGVCLEKDNVPKNMQAAMITRIKILAGMDIAERRLPQDGRIKRTIDKQDIDFRVSSLPGYHGESVVLRILRPDAVNIGIQSLGFEQEDYERFQKIIKRPNGIFLVTGPTGSGKTTTLYAALNELNKPDRKIITAEDPVEYSFAGMNQCQVRDEIGLTFDAILRAMLRQAPNIILVGEIRDGTVADIAVQAALTGHLVFSTLHTNDAPTAVTRLIDMGVKPFLVASSIQAIMAQRLVRVICDNCKVVDENPDPYNLQLLGISQEDVEKHQIYKGTGCGKCQNTGYKGRTGIFELVEMNNEMRELAFAKAPTGELRKAAVAGGMRMLMDDGKAKIFKGITTPNEVIKTSQKEELVAEAVT